MDAHDYTECLPKRPEEIAGEESAVALTSGYVERARASLPRQGPRRPWRTYNNYVRDLMNLRLGDVNDGTMRFSHAGQRVPAEVAGGRR
jgi:hypothetical protein